MSDDFVLIDMGDGTALWARPSAITCVYLTQENLVLYVEGGTTYTIKNGPNKERLLRDLGIHK